MCTRYLSFSCLTHEAEFQSIVLTVQPSAAVTVSPPESFFVRVPGRCVSTVLYIASASIKKPQRLRRLPPGCCEITLFPMGHVSDGSPHQFARHVRRLKLTPSLWQSLFFLLIASLSASTRITANSLTAYHAKQRTAALVHLHDLFAVTHEGHMMCMTP